MRLGATVPMTGRYAMQGRQMAAGLKLWAHRSGASLLLRDDESRPDLAAQAVERLFAEGCDILLGPYGSDSMRTVVASAPETVIWNHGAAADDIQRQAKVISMPSPSSGYLVALARVVARLRPGAVVAVVTAGGRFADYAWMGLLSEADRIDLKIAGQFTFGQAPGALTSRELDAVLTVGPIQREVTLFRQLAASRPTLLLGGIAPGLAAFPQALDADPEGLLAPVQWHQLLGQSPELGPGSAQVLEDARAIGLPALDYIAAQAYAAALLAAHILERHPDDPLGAARQLRTSTFFGDFELDPQSGIQRGHRLAVIRWRAGRQELLAVASI